MFDYEKIPLHWVNRLSFLSRKIITGKFADNGQSISTEEWALLLLLWRKGEQTPSVLADLTFRDRTTITRLVDQMVKKGIVERFHDVKDRRRVLIKASDKGQTLEQKLVPIARGVIGVACDGIAPQDIEITVKTLSKMTQNLGELDKE